MFNRQAATVLVGFAMLATLSAQGGQPAGTKSVMHDITINADNVYSGTIEMTVAAGKVTGKMKLTTPTEITGEVAGTATAGALALEFPVSHDGRQLRRHGQDEHQAAQHAGAGHRHDGSRRVRA